MHFHRHFGLLDLHALVQCLLIAVYFQIFVLYCVEIGTQVYLRCVELAWLVDAFI